MLQWHSTLVIILVWLYIEYGSLWLNMMAHSLKCLLRFVNYRAKSEALMLWLFPKYIVVRPSDLLTCLFLIGYKEAHYYL